MNFLDRDPELARLAGLLNTPGGGLAIIFGRRRIGKTRLLVEWCRRSGGVYAVADQSSPDVQRRYLAEALARRFAGFADVDYPDWPALLNRLASEARTARWHGPVVFDELPYWVASSPELPSVLQRWIDHEARGAGLVVALCGSSQRMMQGLALNRSAPLYGRARELFEVTPLDVSLVPALLGRVPARVVVEFHAAWGGVPRYWELAADYGRDVRRAIEGLVLDPGGPLHREPDRLLLEEMPSALEVRPVLDAIGAGAHRVSEIAGRIGRPATSLSRPLERLLELGLVARAIPFGEPPRTSRRSLYHIADPFTQLWFRVVAPHRAELVAGHRQSRRRVLDRFWEGLVAAAWEELCRRRVSVIRPAVLRTPEGWKPASRWWAGNRPEWDIVAEDVAEERILLADAKLTARAIEKDAREVAAREPPDLPSRYRRHRIVRALFVPDARGRVPSGDVAIVTLRDLLAMRTIGADSWSSRPPSDEG